MRSTPFSRRLPRLNRTFLHPVRHVSFPAGVFSRRLHREERFERLIQLEIVRSDKERRNFTAIENHQIII